MYWFLVIIAFLLAGIKSGKSKKYQKVSVIIPAYNEEGTVAKVVNVIKAVSFVDEMISIPCFSSSFRSCLKILTVIWSPHFDHILANHSTSTQEIIFVVHYTVSKNLDKSKSITQSYPSLTYSRARLIASLQLLLGLNPKLLSENTLS